MINSIATVGANSLCLWRFKRLAYRHSNLIFIVYCPAAIGTYAAKLIRLLWNKQQQSADLLLNWYTG